MASLKGLQPWFLPYAEWLVAVGRHFDSRLVVTSGYRDSTAQAQLYERFQRGETDIPAAPPGRSMHEHGLAFDIARLGFRAKDDPYLRWLGWVWQTYVGGSYGGESDPVHFSVPRSYL